ncbi:hypothetical protein [uncultured Nitrospira sp.]|uniref:hypothetical protein n=1 Tax=uncultured Nitrospira sp. TaxID=157176 RepID=UPI003140C1E8
MTMRLQSFARLYRTSSLRILFIICFCLFPWTPALSATPIENDPKGFFGSLWGHPLKDRSDLKQIDSLHSLQIYTIKLGPPQLGSIELESVKLYTIDGKYVRALFHYEGEAIHNSLLEYLANEFGKSNDPYGSMSRGLSLPYTWRGPETEITLTYHGFRDQGILAVESRIYAPLLLDSLSGGTL